MNLKESKEGVCGRVWQKEDEGEMMLLYYDLKKKREKGPRTAWFFGKIL